MMNNETPKVKTVAVLLINVDDRQLAMLRMAFKMHNTTHYHVVDGQSEEIPELVLVDGEAAGAAEQWRLARQRYPHAKVVYFARTPPTFTAPYLAKPIKFDTLFASLRNLQQGNGVWLADGLHATTPAADDLVVSTLAAHAGQKTAMDTVAATVQDKDSGDTAAALKQASAAPTTPPRGAHNQSVRITRFNTQGTLLGEVMRLAKQEQDAAVIVGGKPALLVFSSLQKVLLAVDSPVLQHLCEQTPLALSIRPIPENTQLQDKAKITLQSCIWQLAIWTTQGRLIEPITPTTTLKLNVWPNMTRLAYLPDSIRLSAFLVRTPVTLAALYKLLPVDMKDLLTYVAASYATGFLSIEQPLTERVRSQGKMDEMVMTRPQQEPSSDQADATGDVKQHTGLLSRLMERLRGK